MSEDSSKRERTARLTFYNVWIAIGAIVIIGVALQLMGILSSVLLFIGVGGTCAYVASPLVNWLERHRMPRGVASIVGLIVVIVAVVLLFVLVIPLVLGQFVELLSDMPEKLQALGTWFAHLESDYAVVERVNEVVQLDSIVSSLQGFANDALTGILAAVRDGVVPMVTDIASMVFSVFLGFVLAYWLVNDYPRIHDEICHVLPEGKADDYRLLMAVMSRSVGGYLRSTAINSIIQGFLAFVGFAIVGHPYAGTMGVLSGIFNIIPVVGPSISAAIATIIALFYSPVMAVWTMVMAILAQNITDNLIAPKINQSTMQVHPVLSLTALVIGSAVGGTVGMVVALPLAAVIKSLFIFYFENRTGEQIVSYDGALFKGPPFRDAEGRPVPAYDALGDDTFVSESQILGDSTIPEAEAMPRPQSDLENPWSKLMMFENPFTSHTENADKKKDDSAE